MAFLTFLAATVLSASQLAPLWVEPKDIASRDLLNGVGGAAGAPKEGETFRFESLETKGHSKGYYVYGADGRKWKVKTGKEAAAEVASSRILWAIGYHQPALYYVRDWKVDGGPDPAPGPGRFRLISDHDAKGEWAFDDNPFEGTRELHGLLAANVLLNNWDIAPSNNRIYEVGKDKLYVVQDLGGSLGKTRWPIGTRNDIDDFEAEGFLRDVEDGRVRFEFKSHRKELLRPVGPDDVKWVCGLLAKLSDRQLMDAFKAAGYSEQVAARYVRKIGEKVRQGVALR